MIEKVAVARAPKPRVLIVDGGERIRRDLRSFLEESGRYQVVGESATLVGSMELAQRLKPQIAMIDVEVAEVDGLSLIRGLRALLPGTALIMVHSGGEEYEAAAREAGAVAAVSKKRLFESILPALEKAANGNDGPSRGENGARPYPRTAPLASRRSPGDSYTMPAGLWFRPKGWREWLSAAAGLGWALIRGAPLESAPERSYWKHVEIAMLLLVALLSALLLTGEFKRVDYLSQGLTIVALLVLAAAQLRQIRRMSSARRSPRKKER